MDKFRLAIDLSLSNSGYTISNKNKEIIEISSIKTDSCYSTPIRLWIIWEKFKSIRETYSFDLLVLERGFSRYNIATQQLFRVHGIINLLFRDIQQLYYAPTTIKKAICGSGKAKKEEVWKHLKIIYPEIKCRNNDESDSLAIMHYYNYWIEKEINNG